MPCLISHMERMRGVHPLLFDLARAWAAKLDFDITITSGVRTDKEQADLYAQGRTKPGKVVTKAANAALSPHGKRFINGKALGCAIDAYPSTDDPKHQDIHKLQAMAKVATDLGGIVWGGTFSNFFDGDHFEIATWRQYPHASDKS